MGDCVGIIMEKYEAEGITLYQGDCLEVLSQIPTVDCVISDPPYNIQSVNGGGFGVAIYNSDMTKWLSGGIYSKNNL